jgi:hypothetical protein
LSQEEEGDEACTDEVAIIGAEAAMRTCGQQWTGMRILDSGDHEDVGIVGELGGSVDDGHVQTRAGQSLQGTWWILATKTS